MKLLKKIMMMGGLLLVFSLAACSKNNKSNDITHDLQLEIKDVEKGQISQKTQTWHITNKRILFVIGYGFNDEEQSSDLISFLGQKYGLDENGGLIYPLVYPDSFRHGTRSYATDLTYELEDVEKEYSAVLVLGAPERTHVALARLQDFWEQSVPFPVLSLFPQDDDLGIESTSDIVIEKAQIADMTGTITLDEESLYDMDEIKSLLTDSIDYLLCLNGSLTKDSSLQEHVKNLLKDRKFYRYLDPETGLQSINHFVIN